MKNDWIIEIASIGYYNEQFRTHQIIDNNFDKSIVFKEKTKNEVYKTAVALFQRNVIYMGSEALLSCKKGIEEKSYVLVDGIPYKVGTPINCIDALKLAEKGQAVVYVDSEGTHVFLPWIMTNNVPMDAVIDAKWKTLLPA